MPEVSPNQYSKAIQCTYCTNWTTTGAPVSLCTNIFHREASVLWSNTEGGEFMTQNLTKRDTNHTFPHENYAFYPDQTIAQKQIHCILHLSFNLILTC